MSSHPREEQDDACEVDKPGCARVFTKSLNARRAVTRRNGIPHARRRYRAQLFPGLREGSGCSTARCTETNRLAAPVWERPAHWGQSLLPARARRLAGSGRTRVDTGRSAIPRRCRPCRRGAEKVSSGDRVNLGGRPPRPPTDPDLRDIIQPLSQGSDRPWQSERTS
jgi:hypothetical protein